MRGLLPVAAAPVAEAHLDAQLRRGGGLSAQDRRLAAAMAAGPAAPLVWTDGARAPPRVDAEQRLLPLRTVSGVSATNL